jgi:predicted TIM-barrel fold metal-dependent hydrolase
VLTTDAQIHVWEVDRPDRPWPREQRGTPQLPNGFSAEQAIAAMDAAGVDRAVLVPPSWIGENNATALEAAAAFPSRFAVMGRIDPTAAGLSERLATWLQQPHMLGIRLTLHYPPMSNWLADGSLDLFWRECARFGIPVMAFVPGAPGSLAAVAAADPDLRLILDHMAVPLGLHGAQAFVQQDDLLALAAYGNVSVKVSAVPCYSAERYPYRDVQPYLRRIYEAFGPRRLLWGSDLTRLPGTYSECADLFRKELDFLSADDRAWIMGQSAAAVLGWPE